MANAVDKEQLEMLSQWWKTYGKFILLVIVVALIVGLGWRYWTQHKTVHRGQAAILYQSFYASLKTKDLATAQQDLVTLQQKFADTPYATLSTLIIAHDDVDQRNMQAALKQLNWVIIHGAEKDLQQIARINAARILVFQKHYPQAQQMLQTIDDKAFQPMIDNVRGDIFLAQNDTVKARLAFQQASSGYQAVGINNPVLQMQLNTIH